MKCSALVTILGLICYQSNSQTITFEKKGNIDVGFTFGKPEYVNYPLDKQLKMTPRADESSRLQNITSCLLRLQVWALVGEPVIHPTFIWSLNKDAILGEKYHVRYNEISKYPDLKRRYDAIRPTKFSARAILNLSDGAGVYTRVAFNITDNDVLIYESEKAPYSVATSYSWGETMAIIPSNSDPHTGLFAPGNNSAMQYRKIVNEAKEATTEVYNNVFLELEWPLEAIDKIAELYDQYESGKDAPSLRLAEKDLMASKNARTYTKDDEWAKPFEDDTKDLKLFTDQENFMIKSGTRTFASYSRSEYYEMNKSGDLYYILTSKDLKDQLTDKKGRIQDIDGVTKFDIIRYDEESGNYDFYQFLGEFKLIDNEYDFRLERRFYNTYEEITSIIKEKEDKLKARIANSRGESSNTVELSMSNDHKACRTKFITTNNKLEIINKKEGYYVR